MGKALERQHSLSRGKMVLNHSQMSMETDETAFRTGKDRFSQQGRLSPVLAHRDVPSWRVTHGLLLASG